MKLKKQLDKIWETGYCLNPLNKLQFDYVQSWNYSSFVVTVKNLYERYIKTGPL